jgi:hypothetical protein
MAMRVNCVNPAPLPAQDRLASQAFAYQCKCMADKDKSREERLALALRENLKRRKAQARELKPDNRPKRD